MYASSRKGFTLIELLVVIAIIAVLAIVVVLTLNPGQLLMQARDSNRLNDLATITSALNLLRADQPNASLGTASTTYVSLPDPSATSTLGSQCQGLGMPSSSVPWDCAASSTFRKSDGTGWLPLNLSSVSYGTPLGFLPSDPVNQSSSNLYYTYQTNGSQYMVTAVLESQKYKQQLALQPQIPNYPSVAAQGTNLSLSALWNQSGLVGYWPMDEGTGTQALDLSGNGNQGGWNGTQAGTSGYYSGGKVGSWAGNFDGSTNYINLWNPVPLQITGDVTLSAWIDPSATNGAGFDVNPVISGRVTEVATPYGLDWSTTQIGITYYTTNGWVDGAVAGLSIPLNAYTYIAISRNGNVNSAYLNGKLVGTITGNSGTVNLGNGVLIGKGFFGGAWYFKGGIDDVRIYNRALSAAEIQALYNAGK